MRFILNFNSAATALLGGPRLLFKKSRNPFLPTTHTMVRSAPLGTKDSVSFFRREKVPNVPRRRSTNLGEKRGVEAGVKGDARYLLKSGGNTGWYWLVPQSIVAGSRQGLEAAAVTVSLSE